MNPMQIRQEPMVMVTVAEAILPTELRAEIYCLKAENDLNEKHIEKCHSEIAELEIKLRIAESMADFWEKRYREALKNG